MNDLNKYKFNEDNYVKDLLSIKEFTNDCFEDVNKMYNCEKYIDDYCIFGFELNFYYLDNYKR